MEGSGRVLRIARITQTILPRVGSSDAKKGSVMDANSKTRRIRYGTPSIVADRPLRRCGTMEMADTVVSQLSAQPDDAITDTTEERHVAFLWDRAGEALRAGQKRRAWEFLAIARRLMDIRQG